METFGQVFKELRIERGYLQNELARILNVTQPTISGWESGRRTPEIPILIEIAKFFKVPTDYLLGLIDNY